VPKLQAACTLTATRRTEETIHDSNADYTYFVLTAADIDKLSITNGDKPDIVARQLPPLANGLPDRWELDKPVAAANGDTTAFKACVDNLKELKVDSQVNLVLDDAVLLTILATLFVKLATRSIERDARYPEEAPYNAPSGPIDSKRFLRSARKPLATYPSTTR